MRPKNPCGNGSSRRRKRRTSPTTVEIGFEAGTPVSVNGKKLAPLALLDKLNEIAAANGVGRMDLVENRLVGIKSRGAYETPGGTLLVTAHRELESLCLDRETLHYQQMLALRYAEMVYYGMWFTPLRESLDAFFTSSQKRVTGSVGLTLFKGNVNAASRKSPYSLYRAKLASFTMTGYNPKDAEGFINLFALPITVPLEAAVRCHVPDEAPSGRPENVGRPIRPRPRRLVLRIRALLAFRSPHAASGACARPRLGARHRRRRNSHGRRRPAASSPRSMKSKLARNPTPRGSTRPQAEDVHHFAESALIEKLGPLGAKLHTGRSRNEMVATEFRMYVKDAARELRSALGLLVRAVAVQAKNNLGIPMPGTTHMQHAQPLLLSHWLLAHGEAFQRDAERFAAAAASADACPLGSGALAGCAFPLDRKALARDLGFSRITANSLDAVSDRDFALESLFALATLAMHLSRLAEDMVLFASPEFGFIELPDEYSTGSSLMPQKKNPDAWELIRGKTGRIYGALFALFTTCKGLPSSYQRDLQEDKEPLFAAHDQALAMVKIAAATLAATKFREARLREAAQDPALVATEVADYLAAQGVPFREAHEIVGKVLRA